jgi:hypothetical protein
MATNAVESWHNLRKNNLGDLRHQKPKYSLGGCCQHVAGVAREYEQNSSLG